MANAIVLVVPRLLAQPPQALAEMRSLATFAALAGRGRVETGGIAKALFVALGADPATPVAPLALLGAGGDPGNDYVLRADPVHLAADRERGLRLQAIDDLSADDAQTLVRMLDRHFAGDGLRFDARRPDAWFARRREPARIATTAPDAARGRSLMASLPSGPDSGTWKRWQNEIEMMLHDHPVNRTREAGGALPVNALWFWGEGRIADVRPQPPTFVSAPQSPLGDLARGIARVAGIPDASDDIAQALSRASKADARRDVFTLALLRQAADLREFDKAALAPALDRLDAGSVAVVHLVADGNGTAVHWMAKAPGIWRRLAVRVSRRRFEIPPVPDA